MQTFLVGPSPSHSVYWFRLEYCEWIGIDTQHVAALTFIDNWWSVVVLRAAEPTATSFVLRRAAIRLATAINHGEINKNEILMENCHWIQRMHPLIAYTFGSLNKHVRRMHGSVSSIHLIELIRNSVELVFVQRVPWPPTHPIAHSIFCLMDRITLAARVRRFDKLKIEINFHR